ncbi:UNVERIFIED_CONTAM: hypothetical protein GTU68_045059 [Idotea baltica]|nr:hypothetical protein [Idotea baltica]
MIDFVGHFLVFTVAAIAALFVPLFIGKLVRPRLPNPEKDSIYECGEPTIGSSYIQFDIRFYVVALLFIIFDVEVAFFFPWADAAATLGMTGLCDILVFFGVLLVGFAYVWKRGDLDWIRAVAEQAKHANTLVDETPKKSVTAAEPQTVA